MSGSLPPSEEARIHHMANLETPPPSSRPAGAWAGWVTFAAMLLILLGSLHAVQGLLALFDEGYFVARSEELVLVSYDAWGVLLILWGSFLMVVGVALNARLGWARWVAAALVMVDVVFQVGFLPSSPLLAVTLIGLDVVILFALTARWEEARAEGLL